MLCKDLIMHYNITAPTGLIKKKKGEKGIVKDYGGKSGKKEPGLFVSFSS